MDILTIDKALELHSILSKYVPDESDEKDATKFIGKIVSNIRESNQPQDYVNAIMLMSGKGWNEIKDMEFDEVLELFIIGLRENQIVNLKSFCDKIGFSYG
jgi:hypothetical protein